MTKKNSTVDVIAKSLEKAFTYPLTEWRLTDDMQLKSENLSEPDYDDSGFRIFSLKDEDVFPKGCWLRKKIRIPDKISGKVIKNGIHLFISINDTAELWINGQYMDQWQWDKFIDLKNAAVPGKEIVILLKGGSNHPMYLFGITHAFLINSEHIEARKITDNLILSLKTAQKLLSGDTYLKNDFLAVDTGIDKAAIKQQERKRMYDLLQKIAAELDLTAFNNGDFDAYLISVKKLREKLSPFRDYAKKFTMYFVSNAHIDAAWLWRESEVVEVVRRTFSSVLKLMGKKDDLTYTQTSALYYQWIEKNNPELFKKIKKYIGQGRWEVAGGMWIEADCNLPDGESWSKQFLYAQQYFKDKFGKNTAVGFNPDSFGYNWNLPQFLNSAGIKYFVTPKINWNDTNIFPYRLFWWQSAEGSKVLTYVPDTYVDKIDNPYKMIRFIRQFEANTGFRDVLFFFGIGDHGGGPSYQMLQRIEDLKNTWVFPKIVFITIGKYFELLEKENLGSLPIWNSELYLEFHRSTYTSQAKIKKLNRLSERLLNNAEKISVLSGENCNDLLRKAWEPVLFNQFHDILPGTSIHSVVLDSYEKYDKAFHIANFVQQTSIDAITEKIGTEMLPEGEPFIVFNPLSWPRKSYVSIKLPKGKNEAYIVLDENGNEIVSQLIIADELKQELLFKAELPALGYRVYGLKKKTRRRYESSLKIDNYIVENKRFKIEINKDDGKIIQITDKYNNKKLLSAPGNELQMFGNKVPLWKAWNINYTGESFSPAFVGAEIIEDGPLKAVYRLRYDFLKPGVKRPYPTEDYPTSFFTQDIILYEDSDMVEFRLCTDWWEDELILKTAFPLNIKSDKAVYEIPYGVIERSTDLDKQENKGKFEVSALRWADLSQKDYGISLLNDSKYGYDVKNNVVRLTMLNSPLWPDALASRGKNEIFYALYPHQGDWKTGGTKRKGYEFNTPPIVSFCIRSVGNWPLSASFINVEPSNIILTTVKYAEKEENTIILQWYESEGKDTLAEIILPFKPQRIIKSDFLEENREEIILQDNRIIVETKAKQTITVKIITNEKFNVITKK